MSEASGPLFSEPVLVVRQKAKLIELTNEYDVFDQEGNQIGVVRQVGQSGMRKALRLVSSLDQFLTHHLEIADSEGNVQLRLSRPGKVFKSRVIVSDGNGNEIGQIGQQNVFGKKRFALTAGEHTYGSIQAENWRAWDFSIQDHAGQEVARITKTWEGLGKAVFTTADHYVLQIHQPLQDPLRALVIASALAIDTALKQDAQGFN